MRVVPLKRVTGINERELPESTDPERWLRYIDIAAVGQGELISEPKSMRFDDAPSRARRLVRPGDTIVSTVRTYLRAVWRVARNSDDLVVSTGFAVLTPHDISSGYFSWWVRSDFFIDEVVARSVGASYPAINPSELGRLPVRLPSQVEQHAIAAYLDAETARIDALIAKKRCMDDLVHERSMGTVDGVLSRAAEEHGEVPLRRWLRRIEQGWSPRCEEVTAEPDEWGVLKTSAVSGGRFLADQNKRLPAEVAPDLRWEIRDGDLLVTRGSGSMPMVARAAVAQTGGRHLMISDLVYRLVLVEPDPQFVALAMNGSAVRRQIESAIRTDIGLTMKVRGDDLKDLRLPAVPPGDQGGLVAEIWSLTGPLDAMSECLARQIKLLHEHRQALITAAVSGDFDVPGVAA